ncbi:hypothetical protein ACH5RR_027326 [Cinchona calisaya]|uniref:Phospholipid/glycerol acyltransferase domain-containing protein n=1 Tax=Cinchona calisaya TaxID=153742 RepID=A0ABD2Z6A2_9GENT
MFYKLCNLMLFLCEIEANDQLQDSTRPGVIVSNHVSYLDILYHMSSSFPSFVAKVFEFFGHQCFRRSSEINIYFVVDSWLTFFFLIMLLSVFFKEISGKASSSWSHQVSSFHIHFQLHLLTIAVFFRKN